MNWSDETVGMVKKTIALEMYGVDELPDIDEDERAQCLGMAIIYAKAALAAVEQSKEWRDRFNGETELNLSGSEKSDLEWPIKCALKRHEDESKEINVYGTEAKYLSDEIDRLKADNKLAWEEVSLWKHRYEYLSNGGGATTEAERIGELGQEIEHLKYDNTMLRGRIVENRDEIERLKADREAEMQGLWRIIEGNREEIERLNLVADAAHKTLNDNLHLADGDNCTLFVLREALAAAEKIAKE